MHDRDRQMRTEHSPNDGLKTYRYLRLGMVAAVVLLCAAIFVEQSEAHCWQTSVSAYYYTPAGDVFVGMMVAVGFALIVIKGRGVFEDACLNFSGMMAPLVAFAPTTDVRDPAADQLDDVTEGCWSVAPRSFPRVGDTDDLATWVTAKIDNNIEALLWAGAVGLSAAIVIVAISRKPKTEAARFGLGAIISLLLAAVVLAVVWIAKERWDDFDHHAHGIAAIAMFVGLNLVAWRRCIHHVTTRPGRPRWRGLNKIPIFLWDNVKWGIDGVGTWARCLVNGTGYFKLYALVAVAMTGGGILIPTLRLFGDYVVLALEVWEILWFAVFWILQTRENWDEDPVAEAMESSAAPLQVAS